MSDVKIGRITVELVDKEGKTISTMKRNTDYVWMIEGPIYPKHMKFMTILNDYAKEADK